MTAPLFAIYGATGHTGRLVVSELLARDQELILAGRNAESLAALRDELGSPDRVRVHHAPVDDRAALRELMSQADVLIHCAGPFTHTGAPVATAAAEAGIVYIDHAIEPHPVKFLFDQLQVTAQRTGAVLIPQLSFYGALADLLAAVTAEGLPEVERVTVGYSVTGWRMTQGAISTAELLIGEIDRVTFQSGAQHVGPVEIRNPVFPFPPPVGPRACLAPFPSGEVVTIPRHVPARTVESQLTSSTFEEPQIFTSLDATPAERARTDFMIAVQTVATGGGGRNAHVTGHDIWRAGALASVEGALQLVRGEVTPKSGVLAAAEVFPARAFLTRMQELDAVSTLVLPG
ncbi:saccharopine dehydrogenase NADP-binding domain-containing protein [Streptomyces sp. T-3]|nr:saccharopine dehydrogenase NADP-binding domain-containing protein [Streptomyces sp. T-3]